MNAVYFHFETMYDGFVLWRNETNDLDSKTPWIDISSMPIPLWLELVRQP